MYYEINVWDKETNAHIFATAPRSITTLSKAKKLWFLFKEKFPEDKYGMSLTYYETTGTPLDGNRMWG